MCPLIEQSSDFKSDLSFGLTGEDLVKYILTQPFNPDRVLVEVKTDRKHSKTKNFFVEWAAYSHAAGAMTTSGLKRSAADYWAFVTHNGLAVHIYHTSVIKYAIDLFGLNLVDNKMPPNPTRGYLLTIDMLEQAAKIMKEDEDDNQ